MVFEGKITLPTEFEYVFKSYSGILKRLDNLIIPNPIFLDFLLCYSTFNAGFTDTKYEFLTICLRSKQNRCELLGGSLFTKGVLIYREKILPGLLISHLIMTGENLFPVNNDWEYFIRGVFIYCDTRA